MIRAAVCSIITPAAESSTKLLLCLPSTSIVQSRGRRRTLTPPPWLPPMYEKSRTELLDDNNKELLKVITEESKRLQDETRVDSSSDCKIAPVSFDTRRTGLLVRKIGMIPQWTVTGERMLCTVLEICENHVVSVTSPEEWYKRSIIGKRKAFNREGPMYRVTVGAMDVEPLKYTAAYRNQFVRAGIPVKAHLGSFLVTEDALPQAGMPLDVRHFQVGQYVTATGKSIDWGFQGGMHRWGMRGQPQRRTTKSHRRIGSVGSVGDARIWPGKRMPGHMGYEWVTVSGLQVVRMNFDKQVLYVKGSVPGDVGEVLLLKDCMQKEKKIKEAPLPTWSPALETISEEEEETSDALAKLRPRESYIPQMFKFTSPSITFTDADAKKAAGRDKTKAKIAKVKK